VRDPHHLVRGVFIRVGERELSYPCPVIGQGRVVGVAFVSRPKGARRAWLLCPFHDGYRP